MVLQTQTQFMLYFALITSAHIYRFHSLVYYLPREKVNAMRGGVLLIQYNMLPLLLNTVSGSAQPTSVPEQANEKCLKKSKTTLGNNYRGKKSSNKLSPKISLISTPSPAAWRGPPSGLLFFKSCGTCIGTDEIMPGISALEAKAGGLKLRSQPSLQIETLSQNKEQQNLNELLTLEG